MKHYVLDACALLALLQSEQGADKVVAVLRDAQKGEAMLTMNKLNLLEVYYKIQRSCGKDDADRMLGDWMRIPMTVNETITDELFFEASILKVRYRISLADSVALAEASVSGGELLTADHHEFDVIQQNEKIKFCWIR